MPTPILVTPRLLLRPLDLGDSDRIQEIFPFFEIVEHMAAIIPWPYPDDGAATFVTSAISRTDEYHWAITEKSDPAGRLIGVISLYPTHDDNRGFWIGRDYQKKGYMKEAVVAVNDFAFDVLKMKQLTLLNAEPNTGSHRLKELAGAKIISDNTEADCVGGRFKSIRWCLTVEDWHANRHRLIANNHSGLAIKAQRLTP